MHHLIIVSFFLYAQHCSSVTVTLTGSADYAVLDQTFRFTCTVTDEDAPTLGTLTFSKYSKPTVCTVTALNCSQNGGTTDYSCGCVSGQTDVYYMNISSVSVQEDEGTWRCQRRSIYSNNITLPVYYLHITSFTLNSNTSLVTVSESDHVTMRCQVVSNPGSSIKLLYGSSELSREDKSSIEYNWTAACRQRGNYICEARNNIDGIGIISRSVHLIVKCSPRLDPIPKKEITAAIGDDTTLTVTLLSYPEPRITWRKTNNTSLRNLTSISSVSRVSDVSVTASLTLTGVQQQDFGEYIVQAENGVGTAAIFTVSLVAQGDGSNPVGLIGGAVAGIVIALMIVIAVVVVVVVIRRRKNTGDYKEHISKKKTIAESKKVTNETDSTDMPVYAEVKKGKKPTAKGNGHHSNKAYQHENQQARNAEVRCSPVTDGLNYVEVEIVPKDSNPSKSAVRLQEERTEYTSIKPGVRVPRLMDD